MGQIKNIKLHIVTDIKIVDFYNTIISKMDDKLTEASLYTIKGVAILDNDGERIFSKYYDETFPTVKEQKEFEKNLFQKTSKQNAEIIMLEGLTVVYRSNIDLYFYIMGSQFENELILVSVLNALYDAVSIMLRKNVEKRFLLDHLDGVLLAIDELVDGGVVLEADASNIVQRMTLMSPSLNRLLLKYCRPPKINSNGLCSSENA